MALPSLHIRGQPSSFHEEESHGRAKATFGLRATCTVLAVTTAILAFILFQRNSLLVESRSRLAEATTEASQSKSDLTSAKAQLAGLQSQLDRDKSQQADMSPQMSKLQTDQQALQAQIKTLQDGRSSIQSQLTRTPRPRRQELRSRLGQSEDKAAAPLTKQLNAANSESADLKSQLEKAQAPAPTRRGAGAGGAMPISTPFEMTFLGGYTLYVANLNPDPLKVTITVRRHGQNPDCDHDRKRRQIRGQARGRGLKRRHRRRGLCTRKPDRPLNRERRRKGAAVAINCRRPCPLCRGGTVAAWESARGPCPAASIIWRRFRSSTTRSSSPSVIRASARRR